MSEETKKISFGFSKSVKKSQVVSSNLNRPNHIKSEKTNVEFIDCLEDKSIRIKDHVAQEEKILVIPLKKKQEVNFGEVSQSLVGLTSASTNFLSKSTNSEGYSKEAENSQTNQVHSVAPDSSKEISSVPSVLTLDEIAAKEILEELNKKNTLEDHNRVFTVPLTNNPPAGEKESSLEDYDNIPVNDFGLAMLRGMGWAPGKGIGKNEKLITPALPTLRPKGMGLGADKVIKEEIKNITSNEDLKMSKGSFIRVIAGPNKDCYGQIEGFDDEAGRLIVKLAVKNLTLSLNEFMVQLVDKTEFSKNSKVINVKKYELYKESENKNSFDSKSSAVKSQNEEVEKSHFKSDNLLIIKNEKLKKEKHKDRLKIPSHELHYSSSDNDISNQQTSASTHNKDLSSKRHKDSKHDKKKSRHKSSSSEDSYRAEKYKKSSQATSSALKGVKHNAEKEKYKVKKFGRRRNSSTSSCSSSESSGYSKQHNYRKKKPSSHKRKSRSRSRSPRKHSRSKSKKHKSR